METPSADSWFVYILRCADGTYYVGHCEDLDSRLACHQSGDGAEWTPRRRPVTLVHSEPFPTRSLVRWRRGRRRPPNDTERENFKLCDKHGLE